MVNRELKHDRRVVVTGLGVISSLGIGWPDFWKNLIAGKSGIKEVTTFDTSKYDIHYAGEVRGFKADDFSPPTKNNKLPLASKFAIAATRLALEDAKFKQKELKGKKVGVLIGTTMGESQVIEQIVKHTVVKNEELLKRRAFAYPSNNLSANVAQYFNLTGTNLIFANACAAGNYAIGYAYDLIKSGQEDCVVAGGVDVLSRIAFTGFSRLYAMAPEKCQPFDKDRKGMMLGEGSGVMVLETLENALRREATIYAEILGYGLACDAHHMTQPKIGGIIRAFEKALCNSAVKPEDVDYINAHGTGTKENDKAECDAIKHVFDGRSSQIPISSIKSMLGHSMGAASTLEAVACCLAIKKQNLPPTINFQTQDPECDIDCVPNTARKCAVKVVLNNAQAFGGNNACLVICKDIFKE
jgi:3-oxoacyl-[acyl-carrier-protein] synthase II